MIESDCVLVSSKLGEIDLGENKLAASKKGRVNFDFYYAALMMFETEVMKRVDLRPGPHRANNKNYKPHEDVAWEIYKVISPNQVYNIDCVDCKSGNGQILGSKFQSEEYWLDGVAVAVHYGRGSNIGGKANRKGFESNTIQLKKFKEEITKIIK